MENFNNDTLIDLLSGVNKTYNSKEVHDYNYYSKYIGLSVHRSGFYGKQVGNKVIPLELTDFVFNSKEDIVLIVEGRVTLKQAPVNNGIGNLYIKGYGFLVVNDSITYDGRLSTNGDVTKSYVDLNDALTLQAAKDYTDANMGVVGVLPYEDDTYNAGWITGDILEGVVDTMFLLQNGNASQSLIITPPSTSSIDGAIFGVKDGSSGTNISGNAVLSGFYGVSGDLQFMKPGETIIFRCFNNIWSVLTRYNKSYSTKKNLSELDDVSFTTLGNKHIPYYDTNVNLWTNLPISGVLGYTPESTSNKVTDLNSPNDEDYPTTNTVKTYVDNAVVGLLNDRGSYNPVSGQYPTTGGSGVGGVPKKGDIWYISANGTINGISVTAGSSVRAIANSPGQTDANWDILDVGLGYVPENLANKITSILGNETNVDRYTSAKAVVDYVTSAISSIPSYTGTPNRITVTGSTIDIASTYAGQTSITTLGTIGTGVWQGTAIADAYIASAATWNGKFNTPTGLTNNVVSKWNGLTFVNSTITDDGTKLQLGNNVFLGSTANGFGINLFYFKDFENTGSKNLFRVDPLGVSNGSLTISHNYTTGKSTTSFNNLASAEFLSSLGLSGGFGCFGNNLFAQNNGFVGNIMGLYNSTTDTYVFVVENAGLIRSVATNNTDGTVIHSFNSKNGTVQATFRNGGLALGASSLNSLTQLDLQSTTKGLGLNLIAGNLGTTRNGLIWYDTVANQFEGVQNGSVVSFATLTGIETLTNKTLTTPNIASIKGTLTSNTDGATITFNKNTSDFHNVTLGGNRTLAVSNMATGDRIVIRLTQDATGSRTVTWFSTIKWAGGTVPTLTTTANKADVFGFLCTGTNAYDGFVIGQNI